MKKSSKAFKWKNIKNYSNSNILLHRIAMQAMFKRQSRATFRGTKAKRMASYSRPAHQATQSTIKVLETLSPKRRCPGIEHCAAAQVPKAFFRRIRPGELRGPYDFLIFEFGETPHGSSEPSKARFPSWHETKANGVILPSRAPSNAEHYRSSRNLLS